ncbi:CIC11C00000004222 [Sungouiella intermedia]|uniref:Pre-mRNA-splicing factor CWC2 n=1 Tax=Sungouiella intermedia TaxID=45354 RepID=A0A1L0G1I0_9ASCO|nr:CIC11C00000004222 [[Candida] intermedia]
MSGKPARLQVDPDSIPDDDRPPQSGHTFNIWYLKWAGGDSSTKNYVRLKFRVDVKRDSGYTKGVEHQSPICLFFARGCCYRGKKCPYLHRLPSDRDQRIPTQDCFGRDKTADYRDDMGGVGLLARPNRTLYVSGIHMNDHIEEILSSNFLEFGSIDKIKVLHGKGCAFVSYRLEAEAQFAKEAMDAQGLGENDVLSVKWANEDPNPNAQEDAKRILEEAAMETVKSLLGNKKMKPDSLRDKYLGLKGMKGLKGLSVKGPKDLTSLNLEYLDLETVHLSNISHPESIEILDASRLAALKKIRIPKPLPVFKTIQKPILAEYASDDD